MLDNIDTKLGGRILKVNHSGEHGAVNIYMGQILAARITVRGMVAELQEFCRHERNHRDIFLAEIKRRRLPRCRSYWFCGIGGFVLGIFTGILGRQAIVATTVAVERVVLNHLEHQLSELRGKDEAAVIAIGRIVADERKHYERSADHLRPTHFWSKAISPIVTVSTETVIWLGMHL